jgi:hypothetical protein
MYAYSCGMFSCRMGSNHVELLKSRACQISLMSCDRNSNISPVNILIAELCVDVEIAQSVPFLCPLEKRYPVGVLLGPSHVVRGRYRFLYYVLLEAQCACDAYFLRV